MPLVRMKAAPVKTDGERLGNEFMNGVFFSAHLYRSTINASMKMQISMIINISISISTNIDTSIDILFGICVHLSLSIRTTTSIKHC